MQHWAPPETETPSEESRRAPRTAVSIRAYLRMACSDRFSVYVTDLSQTGFQVETVHRVQIGATAWLTIPGLGPLDARVAWNRNGHYGMAFCKPLHPAVFDHIVAAAAVG